MQNTESKNIYWMKYKKWGTQMSQIPLEMKNLESQKAISYEE